MPGEAMPRVDSIALDPVETPVQTELSLVEPAAAESAQTK